ncbi:MAG: QacE family quaternary ammonium compound efflux SMR transporter [Gammaproteobacteria bacterium TMED78]|nr:MAG: QacE family quaternary ammonium compound efflux SMR transporter [Gammaproteobacteria bacterium TMED78]|tara:strand:+ start:524 stop:853 length:330 start_codon:yes stop_codon:yes gene_type:complete
MTYLFLALAIIFEVIATSTIKLTAEFTKPIPSLVVLLGYVTSFYFFALVIKVLPLGITYAIWSGGGIFLISIMGVIIYKEYLDLAAIIGIALITIGVIVINVFSQSIPR